MQSGLCTVTRPDIDFTYGEVQLSVNGVPEYLGINADGELNKGRLEALVTPEGWQLPRGSWVLLGPGPGGADEELALCGDARNPLDVAPEFPKPVFLCRLCAGAIPGQESGSCF